MNKIVILYEETTLTGFGWLLAMFAIAIGSILVIYIFDHMVIFYKDIRTWVMFTFLFIPLIVCALYASKNITTKYHLYANGASIEEVEREYSIDTIKGLEIMATKKEKE